MPNVSDQRPPSRSCRKTLAVHGRCDSTRRTRHASHHRNAGPERGRITDKEYRADRSRYVVAPKQGRDKSPIRAPVVVGRLTEKSEDGKLYYDGIGTRNRAQERRSLLHLQLTQAEWHALLLMSTRFSRNSQRKTRADTLAGFHPRKRGPLDDRLHQTERRQAVWAARSVCNHEAGRGEWVQLAARHHNTAHSSRSRTRTPDRFRRGA